MTRANNISIMVSRLPGTPADLARALASGNHDGSLSLERLNILTQAAPTEDELAVLACYRRDGDTRLTPPEQFLLELSRVPRLHAKLRSLAFCLQFPEACQEVSEALGAIQSACSEVRRSEELKAVLTVALAAGNTLNAVGSCCGPRVQKHFF